MSDVKVILISGKTNTGKHEVSKIIGNAIFGAIEIGVIDSLKKNVCSLLSIIPTILEHHKETEIPVHGFNIRELLRNDYEICTHDNPMLLLDNVIDNVNSLLVSTRSNTVIISGIRYDFEVDYIKERFKDVLVINVQKNAAVRMIDLHSSETGPDHLVSDFCIENNGTLEELQMKMVDILPFIRERKLF